MGNHWNGMLFLIFILIFIQSILVVIQKKSLANHIMKCRRYGIVSCGMASNKLGVKRYYLLIVNKQGEVVKAERLEGFTVFSKFKTDKNNQERNISDILARYEKQGSERLKLTERAKLNAAQYIVAGLNKEQFDSDGALAPSESQLTFE